MSIVLPAYNEEHNIFNSYDQIIKSIEKLPYEYELIFINDGSEDNTLLNIKELANYDLNVKYISFSKNFGKEAAIYAGLQKSTGDFVILMDSDLQHPSSLIKQMIIGFEEGYHQVVACRDRKGESIAYKILTSAFYKTLNFISDVNLQNGVGDFRLLSRKAVDALLQLNERHRFSKGLYEWIGLSKKVIYYENVQRNDGQSKWSLSSLISYAIDGILSFNTKPLRLCLYLGMIFMALGIAYIGLMLIGIMTNGIDVPGYFTIISAVLILGGLQIICLGIIGEYIGRIYNETKKRPLYILDEENFHETGIPYFHLANDRLQVTNGEQIKEKNY